MKKVLQRMLRLALDCVYPPSCVACHRMGAWWCASCRSSVEHLSSDPCPRCLEIVSGDDHVCEGSFSFSGVVSIGYYHSAPLRMMIGALKYQGVTTSKDDVEVLLRETFHLRTSPLPWSSESSLSIVPMPLAESRERDRGFNQAVWIAERLQNAIEISVPILDIVQRLPNAVPQATIHDTEIRSANVRGGFFIDQPVSGSVILVDDVMTTGSTSAEVARILIEKGASKVYVFTLALGR